MRLGVARELHVQSNRLGRSPRSGAWDVPGAPLTTHPLVDILFYEPRGVYWTAANCLAQPLSVARNRSQVSAAPQPSPIDGIAGYYVATLWPDFADDQWMEAAMDAVRAVVPAARFGFALTSTGGGQIRSERGARRAATDHRLGTVSYLTAEGEPPVADRSTLTVGIDHKQGISIGFGWPANGETGDTLTTSLPTMFEQLGVLDLVRISIHEFEPVSGYLSTALKLTYVPDRPAGLAVAHLFPWAYFFRNDRAPRIVAAASESSQLSVDMSGSHTLILPADQSAILSLATRNETHRVLQDVLPGEPRQALIDEIPELRQLSLPEAWGGREI